MLGRLGPRRRRLRLHGRARAVPRRPAGPGAARARAARAGRHRVHGRPPALCAQVAPSPQRAPLRLRRRRRPLRAGPRCGDTRCPPTSRGLPHPVFGYFGVVDERLDYDADRRLADAVPHGSVVIVGPCAKVDPAELPRRPNLHWLGQRAYAELPALHQGVRRLPDALRAERGDREHQPDQDARVHGGRQAGRLDGRRRRRAPVHVDRRRRARPARNSSRWRCAPRATPDAHRLTRGIERARSATWDAIVDAMRGHMLAGLRAALRGTRPPSTAEQEAST